MGGRIGVSGNCSLGHRSLDYRFLMLHFPFAPQKTAENMFAREKRGIAKEAKEKEKRERNVGRRNVSSEQRKRSERRGKSSWDRVAAKG